MASTTMATLNAATRKVWATQDWVNMGQRKAFGHLVNRGAVFIVKDFLGQKARGDSLTYDYTNKLTGMPVGEGGTLDGNEEALDIGTFSIAMNTTRIGVLNPNDDTIEQQRTLVSFPDRTRALVPARHAELLDAAVFYHLGGSNPTSYTLNGTTWSGTNKLFVQGHNTPTAPTTSRIVRAGGVSNDQSLTSAYTITLDLLDYALEKNDNSDQPIERFDDGTFDLFISPEQLVDLKQDTTGKIQWYINQQAAAAGGKSLIDGMDMMYDGLPCLGTYAGVNIYSAPRVAYGLNSGSSAVITTVRRAVLVGKNALAFASPFGSTLNDNSVPLKYYSQLKDYEYFKGLEGRLIYGIKKVVPSNGEDVGCMVIATYAAAHA